MNSLEESKLYAKIMDLRYEIRFPDKSTKNRTESEVFYINKVNNCIGQIQIILGDLNTSVKLLNHPFTNEFIQKTGVNNFQYMRLLLSNYLIKINTILDLSIILVSDVYNLGISPKHTSISALRKNVNTKDSYDLELLVEFAKSISEFKAQRNSLVHQGDLKSESLDDILLAEAKHLGVELNITESEATEFIQKAFATYKNLVDQNLPFVQKFIVDLVNSVEQEFDRHINMYKLLNT
nr:Cthe_2314 family HEPN domain-containing protein [uncultured Carboxylicivirga sp.]